MLAFDADRAPLRSAPRSRLSPCIRPMITPDAPDDIRHRTWPANRTSLHRAPGNPRAPYGLGSGRGVYRVEIEGSPKTMRFASFREMAKTHPHEPRPLGARVWAWALRMVQRENSPPPVCPPCSPRPRSAFGLLLTLPHFESPGAGPGSVRWPCPAPDKPP